MRKLILAATIVAASFSASCDEVGTELLKQYDQESARACLVVFNENADDFSQQQSWKTIRENYGKAVSITYGDFGWNKIQSNNAKFEETPWLFLTTVKTACKNNTSINGALMGL